MTRTYEKDLTQGSLIKGIFFYGLPLIFSNLLQVLFNISDVAVVGRFAGSLPLGSVGSTSQLLFVFTGLLMGLGGGVNVIIAYYIGAKSKKNLDRSVHSSFIVSIVMGIILMLVGFFLARPILTLIKTKPELLDGAVTYFKIYMLGMPGLALYNYGNAVL
ncbi:MAG: MATE family efflux transporter, partial [Treponema sp.]|nr:MATE family efflux transporter [Treponema sp.]